MYKEKQRDIPSNRDTKNKDIQTTYRGIQKNRDVYRVSTNLEPTIEEKRNQNENGKVCDSKTC